MIRSHPEPSPVLFPAEQRKASGVQGPAMRPLVAARMRRNPDTEVRASSSSPQLALARLILPSVPNVWGALDYASSGACAGPHPRPSPGGRGGEVERVRWRRPRYLKSARRPFVTDSRRGQSPVPWDSKSFELTRRFPQHTTSADKKRKSEVRSQKSEVRNQWSVTTRCHDVAASA